MSTKHRLTNLLLCTTTLFGIRMTTPLEVIFAFSEYIEDNHSISRMISSTKFVKKRGFLFKYEVVKPSVGYIDNDNEQ